MGEALGKCNWQDKVDTMIESSCWIDDGVVTSEQGLHIVMWSDWKVVLKNSPETRRSGSEG